MILIVCVDDRYGMQFNHRRQSSDRMVTDKIMELSEGRCIWMEPYSAPLFPETKHICADSEFLHKASCGDFCFAERVEDAQCLEYADKIILFHWNRRYPADSYFPKEVLENQWRMVETCDFVGNSHEKITMKVYER